MNLLFSSSISHVVETEDSSLHHFSTFHITKTEDYFFSSTTFHLYSSLVFNYSLHRNFSSPIPLALQIQKQKTLSPLLLLLLHFACRRGLSSPVFLYLSYHGNRRFLRFINSTTSHVKKQISFSLVLQFSITESFLPH